MGMSIADILSAPLAYGLLHMRGVAGLAEWRWLFMIEASSPFVLCDLHRSYDFLLTDSTGTLHSDRRSSRLWADASWTLPNKRLDARQERMVQ